MDDEISHFINTMKRLNQNVTMESVGDLDLHLLDMFNKMQDLSKVKVLMGACTRCHEKGIGDDGDSHIMMYPPVETKTELTDIETTNKIELIKLKSWAMKVGLLTVVFGMAVLTGLFFFAGKEASTPIVEHLGTMFKVLNMIFFN